MYHIHLLLALVTSSCINSVLGAPQPHLKPRQNDGTQGKGGGPTSIQPQIWIPLVVIAALFILGTIVACFGRRFRRGSLFSWRPGAAQGAGVAGGVVAASTREVTADQLAGSAPGNNAIAATNAGTNRARRPRRTRRTPSQISTHSLPVYMKEPGEQEIVIVRGVDDSEDDIPITITMPPVDEHDLDTPRGSFDLTHPPLMYSPVPHTANNVPLLQSTELDPLNPQQHLSPDNHGMRTRASFDSGISSAEDDSQHYLDDAPPYETVVLNDPAPEITNPPISPPPPSTSPTPQDQSLSEQQPGTGSTRRRSVFASIFHPRHPRGGSVSTPPPPQAASPEPRSSTGHTRESSAPSVASMLSNERDPPRSRIGHRPSHSGSGSMFSLLSRTRSNQNLMGADALTSPSMISLHSISSPLTHTLVKTEFTYPRGGPTPDQLRLISSRESFARFGKPYGPDAIAYAASTSRVELEPPPGFEEVTGEPSSSPLGRDSPSSGSHDEQPNGDAADTTSSSVPVEETVLQPHVLEDVAEVDSPVSVRHPENAIPQPPSTSLNQFVAASATPSLSSSPPPAIDVPSPSVAAEESALVVSPPATPPSPQPNPELPPSATSSVSSRLAPPSSIANKIVSGQSGMTAPDTSSNAPPSAFKAVLATTPPAVSFPSRAVSRASSYMSYATAEESLHSPTPYESQLDLTVRDDEAYESAAETPVNLTAPATPLNISVPSTPRIEPRHIHEAMDTTITPER